MEDLLQDINGAFTFSRYLYGIFPWRKCSIKSLVNLLRREDLYLLLFSFGLMYQCFNGTIPSRELFHLGTCYMKKLCLGLDLVHSFHNVVIIYFYIFTEYEHQSILCSSWNYKFCDIYFYSQTFCGKKIWTKVRKIPIECISILISTYFKFPCSEIIIRQYCFMVHIRVK